MSQLFSAMSLFVAPFWLLMILLPAWTWTERIIRSPLIVLPNALIYAWLVLPRVAEITSSFSSLDSVMALLGTPFGTAVAWAHFLAFDLFVGRWAFLDSRRRGIHPLLMAPALVLTFMLGPIGLLLYLGLRAIAGRQAAGDPMPAGAG